MTGIGGIGMSALAVILHARGVRVTGTDKKQSRITRKLQQLGIPVCCASSTEMVQDADCLVYSSAVDESHEERAYAQAHGIMQRKRADALGECMREHTGIAVAGTHGKTTTSAMITEIFHQAGTGPTAAVGGIMKRFDSNALYGSGDYFIAEADEFDRSFLSLYPTCAVITNIEQEHVDCYRDIHELQRTFLAFTRNIPFYGTVLLNKDDPNTMEIADEIAVPHKTFSLSAVADYRAGPVSYEAGVVTFDVYERDTCAGRLNIPVAGSHNVANALAACAVARECGIAFDVVHNALRTYRGVSRRFDELGTARGITVVNDYAHHPTEIHATMDIAHHKAASRIVAVFQPHLVSRTNAFAHEFAQALARAAMVLVTDVYRARKEHDSAADSARRIVEAMQGSGHSDCVYVHDAGQVIPCLHERVTAGDLVVFIGAGDIEDLSYAYIKELRGEDEK
jgi:UDP-N-acetylmuramate--alanine ligase